MAIDPQRHSANALSLRTPLDRTPLSRKKSTRSVFLQEIKTENTLLSTMPTPRKLSQYNLNKIQYAPWRSMPSTTIQGSIKCQAKQEETRSNFRLERLTNVRSQATWSTRDQANLQPRNIQPHLLDHPAPGQALPTLELAKEREATTQPGLHCRDALDPTKQSHQRALMNRILMAPASVADWHSTR